MNDRLGAFVTALYIGFNMLAGIVLILVAEELRRFFGTRGAAELGSAIELMMVAMVLVLWASVAYFVRFRTRRWPARIA